MTRILTGMVAVLCLLGAGPAMAQTTTLATVGGTARDATGALIPGVTVTANNAATGIDTVRITNETGTYQFPGLQPGTYTVSASLPGFQTQVYNDVMLGVAQQVRLNFTLQVGAAATTVEVTVDADTILATTASSVSSALPEYQVTELPLLGRNVLDLVSTQAGVRSGGMTGASAVFAGTQATNVNTVRDGISVNDTRHNDDGAYSVAYTSPDLVEEVRVIVAAADVEVGRGGGQVQMATRSGTNEFHGALFYTNRNSKLAASNWFNNFNGVGKDWFNRNQFGGRIGGPIVPNKTFFFFLYDGQRYRTRETVVGQVLTPEARAGNFRYFPGVQNGNATSNNPSVDFSGNPVAPAGATGPLQTVSVFGLDPNRPAISSSPWMSEVMSRMPLPNDFTTGDGLNTAGVRWTLRRKAEDNVFGSSPNPDRNQYNVRIDHTFNENHSLFGTVTEEWTSSETQISPWPDSNGEPFSRGVFNKRPRIYTLSFVSALSDTMVNEFRLGMRRLDLDSLSGFERPDANGPEIFALLPVANGIPFIPKSELFTENFIFGGFNGTRGNQAPRWSFADSLSWTQGAHAFKMGAEFGHQAALGWTNQQVYPYANLGAGGVAVTGINTTSFPGANGADLSRAEDLLTDLSGTVDSINQAFVLAGPDDIRFIDISEAGTTPAVPSGPKFFLRDWRQSDFSAFFKDDWKATPNLTVNLGLRWDWFGVGYDNFGLTAGPVGGMGAAWGISGTNWDANWKPGASGGSLTQFRLIGPNSPNPDQQLWGDDYNNFGPAIGFSYAIPWLDRPTVVRAGYAVSYVDAYDVSNLHNAQFGTPGTGLIPEYTQAGLMDITNLPVPVPVPADPFSPVSVRDRSQTIYIYDDNRRASYTQSFNLTIQRELARDLTLDIQYVGTKGTKLKNRLDINHVNIFENGLLDAFEITRAGGNAPLFDQLLDGISGVDGVTVFGSEVMRANSRFRNSLANGDVGTLADDLNRRALFGLEPGEIFPRAGLPENFVVVNPQFRRVRLDTNANSSTYHSLNLVLNKRLSSGYSTQVQYTWSRTLGIQDREQQTNYLDPRNRSLNHQLLGFHRTHDFRVNGTLELPFGPGRALLGSSTGAVARLVEGWQLAAIFKAESGGPLTVTASTAAIDESTFNTPLAVGDFPKSMGEVTKVDNGVIYFDGLQQVTDPGRADVTTLNGLQNRYSNRAIADAQGNLLLINPQAGQIGTLGLRSIEGPGDIGLDLAMTKRIQIDETKNFQLRFDAINVLNHPNFGNPNLDINSSSFGRITSATGERSFVLNTRVEF